MSKARKDGDKACHIGGVLASVHVGDATAGAATHLRIAWRAEGATCRMIRYAS